MTSRKPRPPSWCGICQRDTARQPHRVSCTEGKCSTSNCRGRAVPGLGQCAPCYRRAEKRRAERLIVVRARLADLDDGA